MMCLSIISSAAGMIPSAVIPATAVHASTTEPKMASMVFTPWGAGSSRTVAAVATPKVPSDPTKIPARSYPGVSGARPPRWTTVPSARTTSIPRTCATVMPYLRQWGPPALLPMFPPMVEAAWLDGSGAKKYPRPSTAWVSQRFTRPVSTTACRFVRSTARIRVIRFRPMSTPPWAATAPPASPVPAPRGVMGTPASWQRRATAATSSVRRGRTTIWGGYSVR